MPMVRVVVGVAGPRVRPERVHRVARCRVHELPALPMQGNARLPTP